MGYDIKLLLQERPRMRKAAVQIFGISSIYKKRSRSSSSSESVISLGVDFSKSSNHLSSSLLCPACCAAQSNLPLVFLAVWKCKTLQIRASWYWAGNKAPDLPPWPKPLPIARVLAEGPQATMFSSLQKSQDLTKHGKPSKLARRRNYTAKRQTSHLKEMKPTQQSFGAWQRVTPKLSSHFEESISLTLARKTRV